MKQFTAILYFVIATVLFDTIGAQIGKCSKKDLARIDVLGARILTLGKYGRRFPETKTELESFCRETKSHIKELDSLFKGCYEGQTKQFMSIVVFSMRSVVKSLCGRRTEKRSKEILAMGKCGNNLNVTLAKCLENYVDKIQGMILAKTEKRLPLVCCDYFKCLECFNQHTRTACPNQSEAILDLIRNMFQSIVDVACGDYTENSDKCDTVGPTPKKPKGAPTYKSFAVPLSLVWASL